METIWNTMFLQIGRQGENGARVIRADVSQWLENYPSGEVVLFVTRPTELTPYIPDGSSVADGILSWTVSGTDTGISGTGRAELRLMDGDTIVKSEVVRTTVEPCLPGTDSPVPPTPEVTDWVTRFIDSAETVDEALANADAAVAEIDEAVAQAGDIVEVMQDKAPAILSTAGPADVATFSDGAAGMPMEVTVTLDPIQAGSGDPAPDNVRAISGHAKSTIINGGKNLFITFANGETTTKGVTFTYADGVFSITGTSDAANADSGNRNLYSSTNTVTRVQTPIPIKAGQTYTLSMDGVTETPNIRTMFRDANNANKASVDSTTGTWTFTATEDFELQKLNFRIPTSGSVMNVSGRLQFEIGSEATDYEAFTGSVKTVTFPDPPGTVYGGTLTVNRDGTGKLTVDRGYYVFDGSEPWEMYNPDTMTGLFFITVTNFAAFRDAYTSNDEVGYLITNQYKQRTYAATTKQAVHGEICFGNPSSGSVKRFFARNTNYSTAEDFNAGLAANPLQVVFRLNTPVTYDLTAEQVGQITSGKGPNNVWSAGQVEVTYAADTKAYVDGTVGSTETVYNADGYEWVQVSGVPNYGYACEIPLAGIPRQNVAVMATVTAATASDFSGFVAMLAPYYKVDVLAKKVTFYAAVPMYKITRVRAVYI